MAHFWVIEHAKCEQQSSGLDVRIFCHLMILSLCLKLYAKLQSVKAEIQDVNDEHVRTRQELEQTQNELTRELKFK